MRADISDLLHAELEFPHAVMSRSLAAVKCQPEDFEAVHSHTFRVKTFKKNKHCGVCKQTLNKEGLICRGQSWMRVWVRGSFKPLSS
ncbi:tensin-1 isoform X4 [Tachysurus ichikawai]